MECVENNKYTVKDIAELIEAFAPKQYAMQRDNVGLLTGDENTIVSTVLVCCDVDTFVVDEAIKAGAELIISHHPMMFNPINRLTEKTPQEKALRMLIKNDISHYASHTNLDVVRGGLCDYMATLLNLTNTTVCEPVCEENGICHGYGRLCELPATVTMESFLNACKTAFNCDGLRYTGNLTDNIKTVAVNTGGGASLVDYCIENDVDLLVTGDLKYNQFRDAYENGVNIIDISHFDSEKIVMDFYEKFFCKNFEGINLIKSKANVAIVKTFV